MSGIKFYIMKKIIVSLVLFSFYTHLTPHESTEEKYDMTLFIETWEMKQRIKQCEQELSLFLEQLSKRESSSNPNIVNTLGYIGKYQFGQAALKDVGLNVPLKDFINDPSIFPEEVQDEAIVKLLALNRSRMSREIEHYVGRTINNIKITESGLLAAAHLAGAGGVKRFLRNPSYNPRDAYGTTLTDYLKEFSNYEISDLLAMI